VPNLCSYDHIVVAFSGGKYSLAGDQEATEILGALDEAKNREAAN
jgi:hypothetical protein